MGVLILAILVLWMRLRLPGLHEGKRALQKMNMHLPCPA